LKKEKELLVKKSRPWDSDSVHNTFINAAARQEELKKKWDKNNIEGMQTKIKRRHSTGKFVVKTRLHPDSEPKKSEKKNKKSKSKKKS
jgi:hypothetical protein